MLFRKIALFTALISLIIGLLIGVSKSGYWQYLNHLLPFHFLIIIGSFFGTLISLERIITFKNKFLHLIPILNGLSIIFFIIRSHDYAIFCLILGGICMVTLHIFLVMRSFNGVLFLFLISWIAYILGIISYHLKKNLSLSVSFFEIFFLFTITAERIELTKFINVPYIAQKLISSLFFVAFLLLIIFPYWHEKILGILMLITSIWLVKYDIARINIKSQDPHKFRGWALLIGYFWLLIHAIVLILPSRPSYDIQIHTFFLGFVFNMIFAHFSIILPAILKLTFEINYGLYYVLLIIFQFVLILRFIASIFTPEVFPLTTFINSLLIVIFFMLNGISFIKHSLKFSTVDKKK